MDLDYVPSHLTKHNGSASQRADTAQPLGMLKSILENVVPEQQFGTEEEPAEGVSAVAAIARAQAEGQRVFHITPDNLNEVMAEVSISQASREDIQRAVSQFGYEAVVHEAPITVPGWRGSGYILTNPETGSGSYMIDGGKNGGFGFDKQLSVIALLTGVANDASDSFKRVIRWSFGNAFGVATDFIDINEACPALESAAAALFTSFLST